MEPTTQQVGTNEAERIVEGAIVNAHKEVIIGAAIDPITLITLISTLIEAIRNCRNKAAATAHLQRGSALIYREALKRFENEGYGKREARKLARNLQLQSAKLNPEQVKLLVNEAEDVPVKKKGFWPLVLSAILFLIPSVGQAGFWPLPEKNAAFWPNAIPCVDNVEQGPDRIVVEYIDMSELKSFQAEQTALESTGWTFGRDKENHVQLKKVEAGQVPRIYKVEGNRKVRTFPATDRLDRISLPQLWYGPETS